MFSCVAYGEPGYDMLRGLGLKHLWMLELNLAGITLPAWGLVVGMQAQPRQQIGPFWGGVSNSMHYVTSV